MIVQFKRVLTNPNFLRIMSGTIYLHFGFLKFFPDLSPAEVIAEQTVMAISGHRLDGHQALLALAILETCIGLCLLFKLKLKWVFPVFIGHLIMTFAPIFLFPELCFKIFPFAPTMEGQYIVKNMVLFAAVWVVLFPMVFEQPKAKGIISN